LKKLHPVISCIVCTGIAYPPLYIIYPSEFPPKILQDPINHIPMGLLFAFVLGKLYCALSGEKFPVRGVIVSGLGLIMIAGVVRMILER
jgi:hypothetical protein